MVTTMQAISGAEYHGVPSLDILDSVVPYIADEGPKLESEASKILERIADYIRPTISR
jgi:aspartate-semialdehyde dehydrogenase